MIVNLGPGGLATRCFHPPAPGEEIQMWFEVGSIARDGNCAAIEVTCQVVWVRHATRHDAAFGCRFLDLPEVARRLL